MAKGGNYLRLTRKAEGSESSENSLAKLDASARAVLTTSECKENMKFDVKLKSRSKFKCGLRGNVRADSAALDLTPLTNSRFHILTWNPKSKNSFMQQYWNNNIHNKLFQIKPTLGKWKPVFRNLKREQVTTSRLRIDHTRLTLLHLN